jgi:hypothetical protein
VKMVITDKKVKNNNDNFYNFNINFNTFIIWCVVTAQTKHSVLSDLAYIYNDQCIDVFLYMQVL